MRIIAGSLKNRPLVSPAGNGVRPTSGALREALFNILREEIEGARFLDLFAGTGAVGLEALSRGAKRATFIDNSMDSIRCINKNIENLGVEAQTKVVLGDSSKGLSKLPPHLLPFDVIFADPPYAEKGESLNIPLLALIEKGGFLSPGGHLFLEGTESEPLETLTTLVFVSKRRYGRATLWHFTRQIDAETAP